MRDTAEDVAVERDDMEPSRNAAPSADARDAMVLETFPCKTGSRPPVRKAELDASPELMVAGV